MKEPAMFGCVPNITGSIKYPAAVLPSNPYVDGALKTETRSATQAATGSGFMQITVTLDASTENDVYSGSKLQASALQVLACIKI